MSPPLLACRYVEAMRKRKLRGGKQDIAGAKEDDDSRTKDWIVELTAASRALALRWLRAAREGLDGEPFLQIGCGLHCFYYNENASLWWKLNN